MSYFYKLNRFFKSLDLKENAFLKGVKYARVSTTVCNAPLIMIRDGDGRYSHDIESKLSGISDLTFKLENGSIDVVDEIPPEIEISIADRLVVVKSLFTGKWLRIANLTSGVIARSTLRTTISNQVLDRNHFYSTSSTASLFRLILCYCIPLYPFFSNCLHQITKGAEAESMPEYSRLRVLSVMTNLFYTLFIVILVTTLLHNVVSDKDSRINISEENMILLAELNYLVGYSILHPITSSLEYTADKLDIAFVSEFANVVSLHVEYLYTGSNYLNEWELDSEVVDAGSYSFSAFIMLLWWLAPVLSIISGCIARYKAYLDDQVKAGYEWALDRIAARDDELRYSYQNHSFSIAPLT